MRSPSLMALAFVVFGVASIDACSGDGSSGPAAGTERGPCRGDNSCDPGLTCLSDLCVRATGSGGEAGATGAGGDGGAAAGASGIGNSAGSDLGGTGGVAGTSGEAGQAGVSGEAGATSGAPCDPLQSDSCAAGQRCSWVAFPGGFGEARCLADGTGAVGASCSVGSEGFDDCKAGTTCVGGTCQTICDLASGSPCDGAHACAAFDEFFDLNMLPFAGACVPSCDPITQTRSTDQAAACGSPDPNSPTLGCYGGTDGVFLCAPAGPSTNTSDVPVTGSAFLNSCAPGFALLLVQSSTDSTPICSAYCQPQDTNSSATAGAQGVPNSGHTCPDLGAGGTHECRYFWFLSGRADARGNSVGVCFDYTQYSYDSDGDTVLDTTLPSCTTLSATAHNFDPTLSDAQYWGCMAHP